VVLLPPLDGAASRNPGPEPSKPLDLDPTSMNHPPSIWDGVLRRLQSELPAFAFDAWIAPLQAQTGAPGLALLAPSAFPRARVAARHLEAIRRHAVEVAGASIPVSLDVGR